MLISANVSAIETFVVKDIRVEGLQRISAGTVFNYLPVKIGETMNSERSAEAIRTLFRTGFFKDVRLERDDGILVVIVSERPSIFKIVIEGNKDIGTDELMDVLKEIGLSEGRVFDRSLLDKIEQELRRLYFSRGKYGVKIKSTVTPLERNRVSLLLDVSEGVVARIHQINIVGNKTFTDKELLEDFEISTPTFFSFYTGNDKYSRQKLSADLERLRSYYLDRGFIKFNIDSTQVSITPDKKDVYITINITEGDKYTVSEVKLAGELVVQKEKIFNLITIKKGDTFSRRKSTENSDKITKLLGNDGYAFANVNVIPDIDEKEKHVAMTFFVDPGKRVYVRRINFTGNTTTRDEVLRREMRQLEGAWISTDKVERSRTRLDRTGFFEEATVETPAVPGSPDQVDVNYSVKERASGNLTGGLGFSQSQGLIFNINVSENNYLGTGKRFSLGLNTSEVNTLYSFSFFNPYYTLDGVSRSFNFLFQQTDAGNANIADFSSDTASIGVNYGIPFSEFNSAGIGVSLNRTAITTTNSTPREFLAFVRNNGSSFATAQFSGSLSHDTRNRAIFPDRGGSQSVSGLLVAGELLYYKFTYKHIKYLQLTRHLTLQLKGDLGFGDGFGGTTELPFFENFLAGGGRSIRGFQDNTLGPRDSFGDPLGGNLKAVGNVDLIFPIPFLKKEDTKAWRFTAFFDAGNVFDTNAGFSDGLRYSTGIGATWLSPFGALSVSLAQPFNKKSQDQVETFSFSFGQAF